MLKGYRCIRTNIKTQDFGQNSLCVNGFGKNASYAIKRGEVCPSGYRDYYKSQGLEGHNGVDWAAVRGEVVYHSWDFIGITKTEVDSSGGIGVDVISLYPLELADGTSSFIKTRYWHNLKSLVPDGTIIQMGDPIALADSTGASTGNHVHEAIKKIRPLTGDEIKWLRFEERFASIDTNNGYKGAINPEPYRENTFVGDVVKTGVPTPVTLQEYYEIRGLPFPSVELRGYVYQGFGLGLASTYRGTTEQNSFLLNALVAQHKEFSKTGVAHDDLIIKLQRAVLMVNSLIRSR